VQVTFWIDIKKNQAEAAVYFHALPAVNQARTAFLSCFLAAWGMASN